MNQNNWWGEPDDEPLPDWMNPATYRNANQNRPKGKSLTEAIMSAANQPPVDLSYLNKIVSNTGEDYGQKNNTDTE